MRRRLEKSWYADHYYLQHDYGEKRLRMLMKTVPSWFPHKRRSRGSRVEYFKKRLWAASHSPKLQVFLLSVSTVRSLNQMVTLLYFESQGHFVHKEASSLFSYDSDAGPRAAQWVKQAVGFLLVSVWEEETWSPLRLLAFLVGRLRPLFVQQLRMQLKRILEEERGGGEEEKKERKFFASSRMRPVLLVLT